MTAYRIPYAQPVYGQPEIDAVVRVLEDPSRQLAPGPCVAQFERRVAELFGMRHGVMVNSGSSANLLALQSMNLPKGSRVVTPALTFPTTVAPILQLGLEPVFVDVEEGTYLAPLESFDIPRGAAAVLFPLLLGNTPSYGAWPDPVIVDACDTIGRPLPYADIVTTSFYASHAITAGGGGGMVMTHWPGRVDQSRRMSSWGRRMPSWGRYVNGADIDYVLPGYNMQGTEMQAAFGLAQLDRLNDVINTRRHHFTRLASFCYEYADVFVTPVFHRDAVPLAFPLTVRDSAPFTRLDIVRHLESCGIQTRPIMSGNITKQPGFSAAVGAQDFPVADAVMRGGFMIGCHQGLTDDDIGYVQEAFRDFLKRRVAA